MAGEERLRFEILHKGEIIETRDFGEGSYKIGRSSTCEIQLKSPQISKQHALLVVKAGKAAILDLGSSNGVFINGILVRKQRIEKGDEVVIADFKIRIGSEAVERKGKKSRSAAANEGPYQGNPFENGNAARKFEPAEDMEPPVSMTPQEKLLLIMDQKVLLPFYRAMKTVDWRVLLFSILSIALVLAVFLSAFPIVQWGKAITTDEALNRAHTVISQSVRENYRILTATRDFSKLTVDAAEAAQGMLSAYIVDPKSSLIVAPTKLLNNQVTNIYTLIAMKNIIEKKQDQTSVERGDGTYVVAQPIYAFSQEDNDKVLQAIVIGDFEIPAKVYSTYQPLAEAALFALLCTFLAYYFIFKMFTYPIITMQEQLDTALKGEDVAITSEAKSAELETLAQVINFAVSRMKQAGGGIAQPVVAQDNEAEDLAYLRAVEGFSVTTADAVLLLDIENKVRFVSGPLEDLLSMRNNYAQGQNISDACKDPGFAGTAIDLAERVISSLGEMQSAVLDINGISRQLFAVAQKNAAGDIRHVLLTVRLGAS